MPHPCAVASQPQPLVIALPPPPPNYHGEKFLKTFGISIFRQEKSLPRIKNFNKSKK